MDSVESWEGWMGPAWGAERGEAQMHSDNKCAQRGRGRGPPDTWQGGGSPTEAGILGVAAKWAGLRCPGAPEGGMADGGGLGMRMGAPVPGKLPRGHTSLTASACLSSCRLGLASLELCTCLLPPGPPANAVLEPSLLQVLFPCPPLRPGSCSGSPGAPHRRHECPHVGARVSKGRGGAWK